jgi:hypothetical protein
MHCFTNMLSRNPQQCPRAQAIASVRRGSALVKWTSLHQGTAQRQGLCDSSHDELAQRKLLIGRRHSPPRTLPPVPVDGQPASSFPCDVGKMHDSASPAQRSRFASPDIAADTQPPPVTDLKVQQQEGTSHEQVAVEGCELPSPCPVRYSSSLILWGDVALACKIGLQFEVLTPSNDKEHLE